MGTKIEFPAATQFFPLNQVELKVKTDSFTWEKLQATLGTHCPSIMITVVNEETQDAMDIRFNTFNVMVRPE